MPWLNLDLADTNKAWRVRACDVESYTPAYGDPERATTIYTRSGREHVVKNPLAELDAAFMELGQKYQD